MDASRRQLLTYALGALVLVLAGAYLLRDQDGGRPPAGAVALEDARAGAGSGSGRAEKRVWVHVAGAVRRPGVYRVPEGARAARAVARAGGATARADLAAVNLAAPVEDGQQVVVPDRDVATAPAGGGPAAAAAAGGPVALGTATPEQLDQLDGIGPTLAARIVEFRQRNGGIRSVDDLREVEGIGDKRFEALREAVRP